MNSPIYTRIVNHYPYSKVLSWSGTYPIYVPASGEAFVEYDVWSLASAGQRISIRAELKTRNIELWVGVLGLDGIYRETRMSFDGVVHDTVKYGEPKSAPEITEAELPAAMADSAVVAEYTQPKAEPQIISLALPDTPEQDAVDLAKVKFDAHVANKEWAKALEDVKSVYGDRVSFGPRAIMSAKSWDVLVARHKLTL